MNRRAFLSRFGIGVAAACALAAVPVEAIQALTTEHAAKRLACEHLRRLYNAWCQAHPGQTPSAFSVSQGLYAAYESELVPLARLTLADAQPECARPMLLFKGTHVSVPRGTANLTGWNTIIVGPETHDGLSVQHVGAHA